VRSLQRTDVAAVVAEWNRCFAHDPISEATFARTIFEDPNYEDAGNFVAVSNRQIVGFVAAVARDGITGRDGAGTVDEQHFGYIKGLFARTDAREAIAETLLTRALKYLASKGKMIAKVGQYTGPYFAPGVDVRYTDTLTLFQNHGFTQVDAEEDVRVDLTYFQPTRYQKRAQARIAGQGTSIEPYQPAFLPQMRRFVRNLHYPQWFPQGWERHFLSKDQYHYVALQNSKIVGWARFFQDQERWWFGPIAVLPHLRRQGIGTCLLRHSMLHMATLGAPNATAGWATVPFYVKNGWTTSRRYAILQRTTTLKSPNNPREDTC
jgi:ribosomal protein S18 acetylase RimI-like enzyme